jgi:hypothetical protein
MTSVLLSGSATAYWRTLRFQSELRSGKVLGLALKYVAYDTGGIVGNTPRRLSCFRRSIPLENGKPINTPTRERRKANEKGVPFPPQELWQAADPAVVVRGATAPAMTMYLGLPS